MGKYSIFLKNHYYENDKKPNTVYRFSVIPVTLPMAFLTELEQKNSQFVWKHKRP